MPKFISTSYDFQQVNKITNLPAGSATGEPATYEQLQAAIEGVAYKPNARVRAVTNINLAAPGAVIDGVTMAASDRFVAASQTIGPEIGIYIWTGAGTPATRAPDASTAQELENAIITIDEGSSAGTTWRQATINFVLGTGSPNFVPFGTGTPQGSETIVGAWESATQAEANTGIDDTRIMTAKKVRDLSYLPLTKEFVIGDNIATSFTLTHNWGTYAVDVVVVENTGLRRDYDFELNRGTINTVIVKMTPAIATGAATAYVTRKGVV
jgi:hypothetical protein